MVRLRPFRQSKGYCGPASLKMVLSAYGITKSEKYLARLTKTSRIHGCAEKNIVKAAKKLGLSGYLKQHASMRDVRRLVAEGVPVIVDWVSPEEGGHYSVVIGFEKDRILLADPHFGKVVKHSLKWFEKRWFDKAGKKLVVRGIIVIRAMT